MFPHEDSLPPFVLSLSTVPSTSLSLALFFFLFRLTRGHFSLRMRLFLPHKEFLRSVDLHARCLLSLSVLLPRVPGTYLPVFLPIHVPARLSMRHACMDVCIYLYVGEGHSTSLFVCLSFFLRCPFACLGGLPRFSESVGVSAEVSEDCRHRRPVFDIPRWSFHGYSGQVHLLLRERQSRG